MSRKLAYIFLAAVLLLAAAVLLYEFEEYAELREMEAFSAEVSQKINRLYEEQAGAIEQRADALLALRELSPESEFGITISRGQASPFAWYDNDYVRQPLTLEPEPEALLKTLFTGYEVTHVQIDTSSVSFQIANDRLIYVQNPETWEPSGPTVQFSEHWYHFWFPYGI